MSQTLQLVELSVNPTEVKDEGMFLSHDDKD